MKEKNAVFCLFLASFIWGMAFIFQRMAVGVIGPFFFNGIRMVMGGLVLLPIVGKGIFKKKNDKTYIHNLHRSGLICGFLMAAPCVVQQIGIEYTTAGKAGFITSLYVLFVPVFSVFLGKKVSKKIWFCVVAALLGAYFLSVSGKTEINKGDLIIFSCAFLFTFQMLCLEKFLKDLNGVEFSMYQFLFGGIVCMIVGAFIEPISFEIVKSSVIPLLYTGIMSCGVAYTLQAVGQKYVPASKASLPLSLENAWSAIGGLVFLHETMTVKETIGCVILFASVLISQISFKKEK